MGLKSNILEIQVLLWLCPGCLSSEALVLALDTPLLLTTKDALFGIRIGVSLRGLWDTSSSDPRRTGRKKAPRKAHGEGVFSGLGLWKSEDWLGWWMDALRDLSLRIHVLTAQACKRKFWQLVWTYVVINKSHFQIHFAETRKCLLFTLQTMVPPGLHAE